MQESISHIAIDSRLRGNDRVDVLLSFLRMQESISHIAIDSRLRGNDTFTPVIPANAGIHISHRDRFPPARE